VPRSRFEVVYDAASFVPRQARGENRGSATRPVANLEFLPVEAPRNAGLAVGSNAIVRAQRLGASIF